MAQFRVFLNSTQIINKIPTHQNNEHSFCSQSSDLLSSDSVHATVQFGAVISRQDKPSKYFMNHLYLWGLTELY